MYLILYEAETGNILEKIEGLKSAALKVINTEIGILDLLYNDNRTQGREIDFTRIGIDFIEK